MLVSQSCRVWEQGSAGLGGSDLVESRKALCADTPGPCHLDRMAHCERCGKHYFAGMSGFPCSNCSSRRGLSGWGHRWDDSDSDGYSEEDGYWEEDGCIVM